MPEIIPIFPLHTVLFPGGRLPLKIFEPRYLDMVSACMRNDSGFGVCRIREGSETGQPAEPETIGTYARIQDWQQTPDGLLGITIHGQQRFRLISTDVQPDYLVLGKVEWLERENTCLLPRGYEKIRALYEQLDGQDLFADFNENKDPDDAVWLGYRLAELLPIGMYLRQHILQLPEPLQRLDRLMEWYTEINQSGKV